MSLSQNTIYQKILFCLIVVLFISHTANSQTCCSGAAAITGNTILTNPGSGKLYTSLLFDYNRINTLLQENTQITDNSLSRTTSTYILQAGYGFSKNFGISIALPLVFLTQSTGNQQNAVNNFGLGDIIISPQVFLLNSQFRIIQLGIGVKLPTGSTQSIDPDNQIILAPSLQAGTGSTDIITHAIYNQSFKFRRSVNFQQLISFRLNTESKRLGGHNSYQFGNELFLQSTISDQFVLGRFIMTPSFGLIYRQSGMNKIEGFEDINSGGQWIYLRPGISVTMNKLIASLFTELPAWRDLNGFQLTTTYKITTSLGFNF